MRIAALQDFLRNLGAPLAAVGVPPKSLADLRAAAEALRPFAGLDLEQWADFVRRAGEHDRTGAIPAAEVPGLDAVRSAAREAAAALEGEGDVARAQGALRDALAGMSREFGLTATFKDVKGWLAGRRAKAEGARLVEALRALAAQISSRESYRDDAVRTEMERLAQAGDGPLKAAAADLGAPAGRKKGRDAVAAVLAHLTGHADEPPKPAKELKKAAAAGAVPERVEEIVRAFRDMIERADRDPEAADEAEVGAAIERLKAEFTAAQQKEIAKAATGATVRSAGDAVSRIRARVLGVKQALDSQNV